MSSQVLQLSKGVSFPTSASQHVLSFSHFYSCIPEAICPYNFHLLWVTCKYVGILQLKANVYFISLKICPSLDLGVGVGGRKFFVHRGKVFHVFKCGFGKKSQKPKELVKSVVFVLFTQGPCIVFSQIKEIS